MKTNNSLWSNPSYPFRAWYKYIPWFFRALKFSMQRARRGYSDYDVWNLDNYLATLISESLVTLADNGHSYPHEYVSPEQWHDTLRKTASRFHAYSCENDEESTNAFITYLNVKKELTNKHPHATEEELMLISPALHIVKELWQKTYEKEEQAKKEALKDGLEKLSVIFTNLWD